MIFALMLHFCFMADEDIFWIFFLLVNDHLSGEATLLFSLPPL